MDTQSLFPEPPLSPLHFEEQARRRGFRSVAGVDEAGRGPLAGPVVAAAVILPDPLPFCGLKDSKQVSAPARARLFASLRRYAVIGVGIVPPEEIDRANILQASLQAMALAVGRLRAAADFLLVDGDCKVPLLLPQQPIRQGDARCLSIAAASIVAKVIRDRIMIGYDRRYPGYGFAEHKGYGCRAHRAALQRLGPCPLHRRSFRGVREFFSGPGL